MCDFKNFKCVYVTIFVAIQIVMIHVAGNLAHMVESAWNNAIVDVSSLEQVVHDWSVRPFTSMRTQVTPCSGDYENVFERVWAGTDEGCVVEEHLKSKFIAVKSQHNYKNCIEIEKIDPVV